RLFATYAAADVLAATGYLRFPNNAFLYARNAANSADRSVIGLDNANGVILGDATAAYVYAQAAAFIIGTTPATAGALRLANAVAMAFRNAANSGNINAVTIDGA